MLAAGVVVDQVDDDFYPPLMSLLHQVLKIVDRTVVRIDAIVISDIIAVITGGRLDGHQPNAGHTQILCGGRVAIVEIIKHADDAIDISDAIPIRIHEAAHENFVEDGVIPPWHESLCRPWQRCWRCYRNRFGFLLCNRCHYLNKFFRGRGWGGRAQQPDVWGWRGYRLPG